MCVCVGKCHWACCADSSISSHTPHFCGNCPWTSVIVAFLRSYTRELYTVVLGTVHCYGKHAAARRGLPDDGHRCGAKCHLAFRPGLCDLVCLEPKGLYLYTHTDIYTSRHVGSYIYIYMYICIYIRMWS